MKTLAHRVMAWLRWGVTFLCACMATVPEFPAARPPPDVLVVRSAGPTSVQLTREEYRAGMQVLFRHGPLPGAPRMGAPRLILASTDPWQLQRAAGYLRFCEQSGEGGGDCWEVLTPAGGLDASGTTEVALRLAFAEALRDAALAVGSITPEQVRALLTLTLAGSIVALLSPEPVSKFLFVVTTANLIAFVGVDLFNHVLKGYELMAEELDAARDFAQVQAAGERYGRLLGPTLARLVLMVATYGLAKASGLMPGGANTLPGGSRAAALAEAQGFRIPAIEGARSVALAADGSMLIDLGLSAAMTAVGRGPGGRAAGEKDSFDPNEEADSRVLAAKMKTAKVNRPEGTAAHHIVAGKAEAAALARKILARFRIGINDAENGVYLPCNTKTPCAEAGAIHSQIHTTRYYRAVDETLKNAQSREDVVQILGELRARLMAGWNP